jgi:aminoglycoside phosphotransferase (APT) family kinase protein
VSEPSPVSLSWCADVVGEPVRVVRELKGGTHAATHLVATDAQEFVLRRYPDGDDAPAREARVLDALDGLGGWAPQKVGAAGNLILITRLPGVADIIPGDPEFAARELALGLARIHATPLEKLSHLRDGIAGPPGEPVLTHYDYWSGNVLWDGPTLTGIVDWSGAAKAPRGFDVAWCRLDLVLLHGPDVADVFLRAYQANATAVPDIGAWDRFALESSRERVETWEPNYTSLGRTDLTGPELRARHTRWSEQVTA